METDIEESQPIDITSGGNEVETVDWQPIESPLASAVETADDAPADDQTTDEQTDESSPLGKRIRRASSKYEEVENKPLAVRFFKLIYFYVGGPATNDLYEFYKNLG